MKELFSTIPPAFLFYLVVTLGAVLIALIAKRTHISDAEYRRQLKRHHLHHP